MPKPSVTVLTPTYNRADNLNNLYNSLKNQTKQDFVWMIVDDGSEDDTKTVVDEFKKDTEIEIIYIKKTNGGKHTALNVGINKLTTKLVIIVDSDDELLSNAIEIIIYYDKKYGINKDVGGFSFQRVNTEMRPLIKLPHNEFTESHISCRIKNNLPGDMAEVFYSEVLKSYPFPEFNGEKFLSEDVVWIKIGVDYKLVFVDKPIYKCEYLDNGLTANDKPLKFASPMGSMLRGIMLMTNGCGLMAWVKGAIIYNCYLLEISNRASLPTNLSGLSIRQQILIFMMKPFGKLFNRYWKRGRILV